MTDREKLGKLIMESWCFSAEEIVAHLIANGVVVREKGEWKKVGKHDWRCTACGIGVPYEDTGKHFCPNCGADMRVNLVMPESKTVEFKQWRYKDGEDGVR